MPFFDTRDVLQWPGGDNASDTIIAGIHLNKTALQHWNYTLYSNGTMSNGSNGWCELTFSPYQPKYVFANGSFTNGTSCYSPVNTISTRGFISIALAVLYGLCLMFTLIVLTKHGRMYLPTEKRFRPVGRRWQYYWMCWMCATGFISVIMNIDVDRYYLPQAPIVVTAFFWMLLNWGTLACVWEAVRHWGSWMERQYIDPDPFALRMDDKRAKIEFWAPLFFYLFLWLDFFMVIPRNWGNIELQRTPEQEKDEAGPSATDARFKAAAFLLFICWLTIVFHVRHSIQHYRERNRGYLNRAIGLVRFTPYRFQLIVPIALWVVAFQALSAFKFEYSVFNVDGDYVSIFVGGYAPGLLIMFIQIVAGFINPNEDKELIRQRRLRGAAADRELGLTRKPAWWRRVNGHVPESETMLDRITRNVREVGGRVNIDRTIGNRARDAEEGAGNANATAAATSEVEMSQMARSPTTAGAGARPTSYTGRSDARRSERAMQNAAGVLFPSAENPALAVERLSYITGEGPPPPPYQGGDRGRQQQGAAAGSNSNNIASVRPRPATAARSASANTTDSLGSPPQQVRSMLDV